MTADPEAPMHFLEIDADRCQGHGRCYATAPELFEPDEQGNGQVVRGPAGAPAGLARRALLACPEQAVRLIEGHQGRSDDDG